MMKMEGFLEGFFAAIKQALWVIISLNRQYFDHPGSQMLEGILKK